MYIVTPEVADGDVEEVIERVNTLIGGKGGEVKNVDPWGRRKLAYPIRKHLEGSYVVTQLRMEPDNVGDLESNLRISEEILRHLLTIPYE